MSREKQNKGDRGDRGMLACCPVCRRSFESISYDSKTDTCTCVCGWTNSTDSEEQTIAKQIEEKNYCDAPSCVLCIVRFLHAAGYRKQEWISVDERLPSEEEQRDEYGELVPFLVCEKDTTYPYRAFYDGTEWGDGLMKIRGITHWMPLPEAPKMKGGAG